MTLTPKPTQKTSPDARLSTGDPEIDQLLSLQRDGKWKQAVELAKQQHKKLGSPDSERRLVDAYLGRIEQFQSKGAPDDARTLLKLVEERFPSHQSRLAALKVTSAAAAGDLATLVAPLATADIAPALRESIESAIRVHVTDPAALVNVATLPPDHALRVAAAAVQRAFAAVTAGPVTDGQIALPEVSRKSPLADWKLLIRAIACYYRNDDDGCRRALSAIAPDAAVARLSPVLLGAIDRKPAPAGVAGALQSRIAGDTGTLRELIADFDRDFERQSIRLASVPKLLQACSTARPDLLEAVRRLIVCKCYLLQLNLDDIFRACRPVPINSRFWVQLAVTGAAAGESLYSAIFLERFLVHAFAEKRFAPGSIEEALTRLLLAQTLVTLDANERRQASWDLGHLREWTGGFYLDESKEVRELAPGPKWTIPIDAAEQFRRSINIHPLPRAFKAWMDAERMTARSEKDADRRAESVAEVWVEKLPADIAPRLLLAKLSEQRNALTFALKHLSVAEEIDPSHPDVRLGRLRLTLSTLWRHFKSGKAHLVGRDIAELAALPAMTEGDRPVFLTAVRAAAAVLAGDKTRVDQFIADIEARVKSNPLLGQRIVNVVTSIAGVRDRPHCPTYSAAMSESSDAKLIADAVLRTWACLRPMDLLALMPDGWAPVLAAALKARPCEFSPSTLLGICDVYTTMGNAREVAYLATAAGLEAAQGGVAARFLLGRARALAEIRPLDRALQCLDTAAWLASSATDAELVKQIAAERQRLAPPVRRPPSPARLAKVLEAERAASGFPATYQANAAVIVPTDPSEPGAGSDDFAFDLDDDFDDDDFADDDFEDDDFEDDDVEDDPPLLPFDPPAQGGRPARPSLTLTEMGLPVELLEVPIVREAVAKIDALLDNGADLPFVIQSFPELIADLLLALGGMSPANAPRGMRRSLIEAVKREGPGILGNVPGASKAKKFGRKRR